MLAFAHRRAPGAQILPASRAQDFRHFPAPAA